MTSASAGQPWLSLYEDMSPSLAPRRDSVLALFRDALEARPNAVAAIYFDRSLTYADLQRDSDALADWLARNGAHAGARVAILLQNDPQFVIALLAAWKVGAVPVPMNPMYRTGELAGLFADCMPSFIFCYGSDAEVVAQSVTAADTGAKMVLCDPRNYQSVDDLRVLPAPVPAPSACTTFLDACNSSAGDRVDRYDPQGEDLGLILYTSGTTGKPKGAMACHRALAFNGMALGKWCRLGENSRILAIAPLFHITGLVCHVAAAFANGASMVLNYRFQVASVLDAIRVSRPTFAIGAITAFKALMNASGVSKDDFVSFDCIYSGGAPIPPSVRAQFLERIGVLIHTSYGMTETAAPTHLCPFGVEAPLDPVSGALAIGIPIFDTQAKVVDNDDNEVAPGTPGELCLKGPQVTIGYWNQLDHTKETLRGGWLHTGDIAVMDEAGWFYLVDRKKDVIIASGFKVWPREVEDVLYEHPAVREAAVVGVPDDYRGETVKAYVSLSPVAHAETDELIAFCRRRLASYKVPRMFEIMDELPKTVTGKIRRNILRERARGTSKQRPLLGN